MEERFKKFPKYIRRAPDANLCVRVDVAKKVKFDERFFWSWESDFGYRLTELGKMKYIPDAIIYHYHRSTWRGFFRQQMNNGKATPMLFLTKRREKITGDHISTFTMGLAVILFYFFIGFLLLGLIIKQTLTLSLVSLVLFTVIIFKDSFKLSNKPSEFIYYMGIFLVRAVAWVIGIPIGFLKLILGK